MRKSVKKLNLSKETLKGLDKSALEQVAGGMETQVTCFSCLGQPCPYK
jgi:hypothetical protein